MADDRHISIDIDDIYAMFWRLVHIQVHRYGSAPTGELLVVLTIILLDGADHHTTVTELAEITGMPKSSVSRYVSREMSAGMLEEVIDSRDRRRRLLRPTLTARRELEWHRGEVRGMAERSRGALAGLATGEAAAAQLKAVLQSFLERRTV